MSIMRTYHNKENPYVMLSKKTVWDSGLSLAALGLWTRCMACKDGWSLSVAGAATAFKESSKKIYKLINELIAAGYAMRGQRKVVNPQSKRGGKRHLFTSVEYIIFEYKASPEEIAEFQRDFQKLFPLAQNGHAQNGHAQNGTLISNEALISNEEQNKEPQPPLSAPEQVADAPSSSAEASEISSLLLEKVKEIKPDIKLKKVEDWPKEVDRMIRLDGRSAEKIRDIVHWLPTSDFWRKVVHTPQSLRKNFDKIEMSMNDPKTQESVNRQLVQLCLKDIPHLSSQIEPKYAYVSLPGVGKELYYANHSPERFKELFYSYLDLED
jgi:hypothetical protein